MSKVKKHKFKKFSKMTKKICRQLGLPLYNSKYSNKIFTNQQKIFLLVYKTEKKLTYRELEEDLYDSKIPEYIGLRRIPRWQTLQMFVSKLVLAQVERMITLSANLVEQVGSIIGIDGTGMSLDTASHHYCKRINRKKPIKGFVSFQAMSDLDNQVVRSVRLHKKRMHDSRHLIPLYNKAKHPNIEICVADKGYDSEKNMDVPKHRTTGPTRKMMKECFDWGLYFQRNKCETIFSVIKRKYGSVLKSRTLKTQKIDTYLRILAYNLNKVAEILARIFLAIRVWSEPLE